MPPLDAPANSQRHAMAELLDNGPQLARLYTEVTLLRDKNRDLEEELAAALDAMRSLIEIGKRDLTNPKYDGYFDAIRECLAQDGAIRARTDKEATEKPRIITVLLSDVKSLPENERLAIRNYVIGGGILSGTRHVRYKNHPEVRRILSAFHIKEIAPKGNDAAI